MLSEPSSITAPSEDSSIDNFNLNIKEAQYPFNKSAADAVLRASDRVHFRIRRCILMEASPVFEDMFSIPQNAEAKGPQTAEQASSSTKVDDIAVMEMSEDSTTMDSPLLLCYPVADPKFTSPSEIRPVLGAASKYMMEEAEELAKVAAQRLRPVGMNNEILSRRLMPRTGQECVR